MPSTKYQYFSFLFLLLIAPILVSATPCDKADESILFAIKSELNNPPGHSSWSLNTSCCTWNEIDCNSTTSRVTALTIFGLNVSVPIPPSIAKLTTLQTLNLPYDQLYGPIPPFLGLLPELTSLRLDGNMLTGSIPPTLTLLLDLLLVGNWPTGPLPPSSAKANFATLDLADNQLTGDASFLFGRDKNLNALYLSNNKFKFNLTNVEIPEVMAIPVIDHNETYGSIPAEEAAKNWLQFNVTTTSYAVPFHRAGTPIGLGQNILITTSASAVPACTMQVNFVQNLNPIINFWLLQRPILYNKVLF